jgi:hypothetical protein
MNGRALDLPLRFEVEGLELGTAAFDVEASAKGGKSRLFAPWWCQNAEYSMRLLPKARWTHRRDSGCRTPALRHDVARSIMPPTQPEHY